MNRKTYIQKTNTIVKNSTYNTSQNPVCELYYGDGYSRVLLYFEIDKIKSLFDENEFIDSGQNSIKHYLKMKNCWGLQSIDSKMVSNSGKNTVKERTSSFDLYLVRIPQSWDSGSGNDFTVDGFLTKNYIVSENGSNWFNSSTEMPWNTIPGIFSGITSGNTNIISTQHFEIGNEDIEFDITDEINRIISGTVENNGFMICFPELLEQTYRNITQYVGFFTDKTNTFFKPYIESRYDLDISDDRNHFFLNKPNTLYFYSMVGGELTNLDSNPVCTIYDDQANKIIGPIEAKIATKGVYYIDNIKITNSQPERMYYDIWSNIIFNGDTFQNVELEFSTLSQNDYYRFGNTNFDAEKYIPMVYGINVGEKINMGQIKQIFVNPRVKFTTKKVKPITGMEYRIYVKEADREITVIDYDKIHRTNDSNYFTLYTDDLLPNKYFVDIKIKNQGETNIYKEKLMFEIVNVI